MRFAAAAVLSGSDSEARGKLTTILELTRIAHRGDDRIGRERPNPRATSQANYCRVTLALPSNLSLAFCKTFVQYADLLTDALRHQLDTLWIGGVTFQFRQFAPDLGGTELHDDAKLREQSTNAVKQRGSFRLPSFAQAVPSQALLLFLGLDGDKAHSGRMQCREHGFSITRIVLDALVLSIGSHELGGNEPGFETECLHRPPPTVRRTTCFHRHHRARWQRAQPLQKLAASEQRGSAAMTTAISLANGKNGLCQVNSYCRSIHLDFPFLRFRLMEIQSWHIDAGWLTPPAECGKSSL
jgi:hypothetical protein